MGLPDLEIFGLRVSAVMVAILAFLTYQFGWWVTARCAA